MVQPVQERLRVSKLLVKPLVDKFSFSTAMRVSITKLWDVSLLVW